MTRSRLRRRFGLATLVGYLTVAAGCSSAVRLYPVYGTVKYKGRPIEFGTISFRSAEDATGAAQIENGRYQIPGKFGLPAGQYNVAVTYPDPKVPRPVLKPGDAPGEPWNAKEILPDKYHAKTQLTAEVRPQLTNEVNFDLD